MKFSDGYWHMRDGVALSSPTEIRDIKADADSLTLYAACRRVERRGDTLNEPLLTIRYFSPMPDVIGVKITHHSGKLKKPPVFEIREAAGTAPAVAVADDACSFTSGNLAVTIARGGVWKTDVTYNSRRLTGNLGKSAGYLVDGGKAFVREQLELGVGESVYGLGERFTPFVKNGQVVDIWNEDGGTSSEQSYKNIPFYLSSAGYGVFVRDSGRVSYEIASEVVSRVQFSVPGEELEYYIVGGADLKDVLRNYTALTGRPSLPPAWSFGLWLTTSFTTSYDEKTVTGFIDGMAQRNLPLHVFHFDCFWMKEYQWCDFEWDKDLFPDPQAMLARLKKKGLHICVWINPYIAQKSCLFDEGMEHGYLVKTPDGSVWQWDRWQAGMGLVDFTNPDAVEWFQSKLRRLVEMGVDCFKTDFGERIPTDVVYFDGSDPEKMHNYYTFLYNKAVFDVLEETRGKGQACLFARSATAGGQQFPVHWGGDCSANYASMAETLRGGLSLGLSGFGFWSHDISGFEKTASPDVYKRWVAFGLLSSHSRLHGSESYRVPWLFDEESVDVLRFFTNLKCSLMPYVFAKACEAVREGLPMMRAMVLEFPEDRACAPLDTQYMLGDSLLVAPIFNDRSTAEYYLPAGLWTDFITGRTVEGGTWRREAMDYFHLPLLARQNSLIAVGTSLTETEYEYEDGAVLHLFALQPGACADTAVFSPAGKPGLTVTAERDGKTVRVKTASASKPWKLLLRSMGEVASVSGGSFTSAENGVLVTPDAPAGNFEIILK